MHLNHASAQILRRGSMHITNPIGAIPRTIASVPESDSLKSRTLANMILGLGTDMIEIARIDHSITRYGEAFLHRIYTPAEIAYCRMKKKNAAESFAARFAAKEAAAKALGTGISRGVTWREFEVLRPPGQRPTLHLSGRAASIATHLGVRHVALSLSHTRDLAIAIVIAED